MREPCGASALPAPGRWLGVVGVQPDEPPIRAPRGAALLAAAATVVGGPAELAAWRAWHDGRSQPGRAAPAERDPALLCFSRSAPGEPGGFAATVEAIAEAARPVCVLASGDPGFFGAVRALASRFGRDALEVVPGVSSVALAFARLALPWDDAVVVSAHGRSPGPALELATAGVRSGRSVALLADPQATPAALAAGLCRRGFGDREGAIFVELGGPDETVAAGPLATLRNQGVAPGQRALLVIPSAALDREPVPSWTALPSGTSGAPTSSSPGGFDLPVDSLAYQRGQVTKPEVRAVVLAKLDPPADGVCWDVGAGSGSVALACVRLRPGLRAFAIERDPAATADITANATALGVEVAVVTGEAPAALGGLPAPDCVFVGGGGTPVLEAVWEQVPPGTRVVATLAALARAERAGALLGNLVQVQVSSGRPLPDGAWRLAAENPVFVAWGARP